MIVIIGAGVSGLACAACMRGDVTILEAQEKIGGYCQTTKTKGYVWDRSGHFFHFRDAGIKSFFDREMDADSLVHVNKKTSIYLDGIGYVDFPFQKNIHQLPKDEYVRCLIDLYNAEKENNEYRTFKEFVYATMGRCISDLFLIPYNQKLYACDLDSLDCGAMGRFFPRATFEEVLLNAVNFNNDSYNDLFSYPVNGAEDFVNVLSSHVQENGTKIRLGSKVVSVDLDSKKVQLEDGSCVEYSFLVNTSPLDSFFSVTGREFSKYEMSANKVAVFNMGFDKPSKNNYHWQYFPGDEVFYRVGSYCNILGSDRESLYVEVGLSRYQEIDEISLLDNVLRDLASVGVVDSDMSLVDYEFLVMDPAYVHINKESESLKARFYEEMDEYQVYSIGRYGGWTYCSIEDCMIEARSIAEKIASRSKASDLCGCSFVNLFR